MAPKSKTFIWFLLDGKVKTYDYLYRINLGPHENCVLCGLVPETVDHLFRTCNKSQFVWNSVQDLSGMNFALHDHIANGTWLDYLQQENSKQSASLIAATIW